MKMFLSLWNHECNDHVLSFDYFKHELEAWYERDFDDLYLGDPVYDTDHEEDEINLPADVLGHPSTYVDLVPLFVIDLFQQHLDIVSYLQGQPLSLADFFKQHPLTTDFSIDDADFF
jgi:hypothetical protein